MERLGREFRDELGRFGPQAGMLELVEQWPDAVGAEIARRAWPARIARDGTAHVNTADSVWAFELGQRATEIAGRLGVASIRFAPGPLPEPPPAEPPSNAVLPTEDDLEQGRLAASSITDDELREKVQRAASLSLARTRDDPPI
jgi:hypothetical protein